jgi:hypothetical protein
MDVEILLRVDGSEHRLTVDTRTTLLGPNRCSVICGRSLTSRPSR